VPEVGHFPEGSQVREVLPLQLLLTFGVQTAPHCPGVMVPLSQVPWLLQVCGVVPEQLTAPGEQTPTQAPPTQALFVHALGVPHFPLASQVCRLVALEQVVVLGSQTPVQAPFTHAWFVQARPVPHFPVASQVCTALSEQVLAPLAQTPVQAPLTHVWLVHGTAVPHAPVALQV